jgi:hypothetical protein
MSDLFALARKGASERPDDLREALRLYCERTGKRPDNLVHFRAAVSIGRGRTFFETVARMTAYDARSNGGAA